MREREIEREKGGGRGEDRKWRYKTVQKKVKNQESQTKTTSLETDMPTSEDN